MIEPRFANRDVGRLDALAAELVDSKVDIIVAAAPVGIRAAQKATTTIPIVMAFSGDDPVKAGFVQSLGRPGGNVTGVTALSRDLVPKWMELLREVAPGMTRIAMLINPTRLEHGEAVKVARASLPPGVRLQVVETRTPEGYPAAFAEMTRERAGGLIIVADVIFTNDVGPLADLAKRHRLPTVYQWSEFVRAGGLMSYGPDHLDLMALMADYVIRIMKGAIPSELPVLQPKSFELGLNLKTAGALGLTIPESLRLRAGPDHVIAND